MQTKQQKQQKVANKLANALYDEIAKRLVLQRDVTYIIPKSYRESMIESQLRNLRLKGIIPDTGVSPGIHVTYKGAVKLCPKCARFMPSDEHGHILPHKQFYPNNEEWC